MHIILGATGHIGSVLAQTLLDRGESVTVVSRDAQKADHWKEKGAQVAIADVHDVKALRKVFQQGTRLFLLNPPAPPSTDTTTEERRTLASILTALEGSGLEKIVAQSAYGAQPGDRIGDLSVLYEMEQALAAQPIPYTILRAAYYMSNWDASLQSAQQEGQIYSFYPLDFQLPMVAPHDIAQVAAGLMVEPVEQTGLHFVEGPEHYCANDVAAAFTPALNRPVKVTEISPDQWIPTLKEMGFSNEAAESFARMNAATLAATSFTTQEPIRGTTSIQQYVNDLVAHPE